MTLSDVLLACLNSLAAFAFAFEYLVRRQHLRLVERRLSTLCARGAEKPTDDLLDPMEQLPLGRFLMAELVRAGAEKHRDIVVPYIGATLTLSCLATIMIHPWCGAAVLAAGTIVPCLALKWLQKKRLHEFIDRLPVFLERVRQLVLIGNPIQYAFLKAISDADPICKVYFDGVSQRVHHGAPFPDSVLDLARRLRIQDVHMLSACVKANSRYGGRISNNLANLVAQLNNKRRLDREIRAATAETRTSVAILLALTAGLTVFVLGHNPSAIHFFLTDHAGRFLLFALIGFPAIGLLVMQRILKIDL